MSTEKRARQRANKLAKQAAERKKARRVQLIKRARRVVFYSVLFAIVFFVALRIWGNG